ncbi:hypothetical protein TWF481_006756 [Arthrobotrys musiformis]|uniref:F-box domain-containing protein n=1 Tax=Arthrobotrys musiformis TaxID=47236 RepID=A0AAV9WAD6_9PEZI
MSFGMPTAITTLPSELVSLILTHLSLRDTLSLLQTCKSLYLPSLHHLYSTLHLCDRIPGKYNGPPCPPFTHNPLRAVGNDGCRALARTINEFEKRGDVMPGFGFIRGLVLEPEVFSRSTACMRDGLLRVLGDRIEEGGVAVRWVKVSVWGSYLETSDDPPTGIERFLKILKEYSEGRTTDDFSIILDANFITSISQWYKPKCSIFDLIDLEKVTSLDIQIFLHDDDDEAFQMTSSEDGDGDIEDDADDGNTHGDRILESIAGKQATDLTALLTKTVNLRTLKLVTDNEDREYNPPPIGRGVASLLNNLQTAFSSLKQLEWLYLRGEMFHPSFFITPPPKVRVLKIKCVVSVAWWRRFANAELKGVSELVIYNSSVSTASWMGDTDQDDYFIEQYDDDGFEGLYGAVPKPFDLGSVRVEGLRQFWLQGGFRPRDLGECIANASKVGTRILGDLLPGPEAEVLRAQGQEEYEGGILEE